MRSFPIRTLCRLAPLILASSIAAPALGQFTYSYFPNNTTINTAFSTDFQVIGFSGGQYNPDTLAREFSGPSSPTVTIADGAVIPDAEIFNSSIVNATGGAWTAVTYDNSTLNVLGGVNGNGASVLAFESSTVNVHAGLMFGVYGQNQRTNIFGGSIRELESNVNTDFLGNSLGSCITEVTGGTFLAGGYIAALNAGILNLRGGLIQSDYIAAAEGGTLNIYGTNLVAQLINPNSPNGSSIYRLNGFLADGSPLNNIEMRIRNDGVTYGTSRFNLITVPTPASLCAIALGGLRLCRRRCRASSSNLSSSTFAHCA